ncbi:YgaP family membrane protein [Algoriphagus machipongonensis]|uniref:Membrane protein n=1 Tax=Algoriphagus machipongonensis TaxID=388413 RepID=A3I0Y3_9BACT|nr:DUF2892 domain-containing protein [Algoriphagus machipongonensis]EAZ80129.1 membrane protein [Algoriphagus machipongonensis]
MKRNMGNADRVIRLVVAAILVGVYYLGVFNDTVGYLLLAVAAIFTFTSIVSICPLYAIFGIKTCSRTSAK